MGEAWFMDSIIQKRLSNDLVQVDAGLKFKFDTDLLTSLLTCGTIFYPFPLMTAILPPQLLLGFSSFKKFRGILMLKQFICYQSFCLKASEQPIAVACVGPPLLLKIPLHLEHNGQLSSENILSIRSILKINMTDFK